MRQGTPHTSERLFPNGRVIELIGNPMPGGGFVMSFTDITAYREPNRASRAPTSRWNSGSRSVPRNSRS